MATNSAAEKQQAAVTFVLGCCWVAIAMMAVHQLQRFVPIGTSALGTELLAVLLIAGGLYWIGRRTVRNVRPLSSIGLVQRPTQWKELATGLALGWSIALVLLLPALFTRHMQSDLQLDRFHFQQAASGVFLLLANAIITQLVLTGLLFRSLVRAASPTVATVLFSCLAAAIFLLSHPGALTQTIFVAVAQVLFSVAALRTRAIWLPLGIQLAWSLVLLLVFGVSSFYWPPVTGVVKSYVTGTQAWTGGYLGPEGSAWAFPVMALALIALGRVSRDYAWHYTFDGIEGAAYPMDVAPPKEHTLMEAHAAKQSVLVQIAPVVQDSHPGTGV